MDRARNQPLMSFTRAPRVSRQPVQTALLAGLVASAAACAPAPDADEAGLHAQPSSTWQSLGPTEGDSVDDTGLLADAESGLVEAIRVDPRNSNTVVIATAGGGLWRT